MVVYDPGVFPLPTINLPHPPTSWKPSRRLQQRYRRAVAVTQLANKIIISINTLSTSFSHCPSSFVSTSVSRTRIRLLSHIYHSARQFVRRQDPSQVQSGSVHVIPSDQWNLVFDYSNPAPSPLPIVADRVSLPSVAGTARLLESLPPHLSSRYADPKLMLRPIAKRCRVRPSAHCASRSEYVSLIRRLLSLRMVCLRRRVVVVNGVFAVAKDDDKLRLIIDARPANALFVDPPTVQLPTPDLFAHIIPDPHRPFFVAKVDIDNFYHRLLLPEWMQPLFGLPPILPFELGLAGVEAIYPCCVTLPMGWSHSVFVSQSANNHITYTRTSLSPTDAISPSADLRLTRTLHGQYIDDTFFIGHDKQDVWRRMEEYKSAIEPHLPHKHSKTTPEPRSDGVEVLGLRIDGSSHTVGLSVPKLQHLIHHTLSILRHGRCTGLQLAQVVGRWVWAILVRRPALAVFSAVYRFIQCAQSRLFTIWHSVHRELNTIIGLAPLLLASLDAPFFSHIIASDASEFGLGVVAARCGGDRMYDISTHCPPPTSRGALQQADASQADVVVSGQAEVDTLHRPSLQLQQAEQARQAVSVQAGSGLSSVASLPPHENSKKQGAQIRGDTHAHDTNLRDFLQRCGTESAVGSRLSSVASLPPHANSKIQGAQIRGDIHAHDINSRDLLQHTDEQADVEQQQHVHASPPPLHDLRWSVVASSPWRRPLEHINSLELRALSTAIRWALSHPHSINRRLLLLSDSSVTVFSVSKGRSSAFQILRRLRYISSLVLAAGLQPLLRWIPSAANPADGPSRSRGW